METVPHFRNRLFSEFPRGSSVQSVSEPPVPATARPRVLPGTVAFRTAASEGFGQSPSFFRNCPV